MGFEHGGAIIGAKLREHGVQHIFTLCGGHISPILTGAETSGIKVIDVRHEASAAFAADATARMTGIPGVVAVTAGPGVTNTITAVKNAQMAQSPIVILGGATATILKGRGSLQDIDQLALMEPLTKWAASVKTVNALGPMLDRAFEVAMAGTPGPVFLEIPVDLLYPEDTVKGWYLAESGAEKMKGAAGIALRTALKAHMTRIFHAPYVPVTDMLPSREEIGAIGATVFKDHTHQAFRTIEGARKPVLVIGGQALVNMTPSQGRELADAVESLGIPTFLGGSARGLLGRFSQQQFRHQRSAALREADVVLVAGFPFDFRLGYGRKINKKATLISVNLNAEALRKNRRPDIAIQSHPGHFLIDMSRRARTDRDNWLSWFGQLREREDARDTEIAAKGEPAKELVNPVNVFLALEEVMEDDSVLVVDGGDFVATGAYILRPRKPMSWLDPGVFGTLGVGGGFALGAACARPDAELWLIWGDGSSAYSLAEFDTFVRHGFAPIAIIGTDASWAQIAREQVDLLGTPLGTELRRTDYQDVARGYGGEGILVTEESQLEEALTRAKALARQGKPVVINVHLATSDFRKGSISI